jgi:hypothetical protein
MKVTELERVVDQLRERIADLPLCAVAGPQNRKVRDRNRIDRPALYDAVYLDDVWQALDDLTAAPKENGQ